MSGPLPRRRAPLPRTRARLSSTVRPAPPFWSHRPCPTHTIKSLSSSIENLVFCIFLYTVQVTFLPSREGSFGGAGAGLELQDSCARL